MLKRRKVNAVRSKEENKKKEKRGEWSKGGGGGKGKRISVPEGIIKTKNSTWPETGFPTFVRGQKNQNFFFPNRSFHPITSPPLTPLNLPSCFFLLPVSADLCASCTFALFHLDRNILNDGFAERKSCCPV